MLLRALPAATLIAFPLLLSAQWVQGGMFSVFNHFQACAFHHPDSGLFVYGSDNPVSGEGGVIATYDGLLGGGFYLWYESPMILEDIDVKVSDGFPIYLAAGSQSGGISVVLRPYETFQNPFFLDSVRTGSRTSPLPTRTTAPPPGTMAPSCTPTTAAAPGRRPPSSSPAPSSSRPWSIGRTGPPSPPATAPMGARASS